MIKVFLSPSDQGSNTYAWGDTNEEVQCKRIADYCEKALLEYEDVSVYNDQDHNMYDRVSESNLWEADVHVCIHTNASTNGTNDGKVGGTRVFYYSNGGRGHMISEYVFDELAPLTPGSDKLTTYPALYEIKNTYCPCVYCECEFHDNAQQAKWIIDNVETIGKAIATGIAKYFGLKKKANNEKIFTLTLPKNTYDKVIIEFE